MIVYGIIPQTQASREQLELGVYPSSIGGGYLYEVKRLDAKIGDPGTEIPCVVADMFSDYLFKTRRSRMPCTSWTRRAVSLWWC